MSAELLRELAHIKAVFQLRAIEAIITNGIGATVAVADTACTQTGDAAAPNVPTRPLHPAQRVHRKLVNRKARDMRRELGMVPSKALET